MHEVEGGLDRDRDKDREAGAAPRVTSEEEAFIREDTKEEGDGN